MGFMSFFWQLFKGKKGAEEFTKGGTLDGEKLVCADCRSTFLFESGEQRFYKMRGLTPPKRCSGCRSKRKHRRR